MEEKDSILPIRHPENAFAWLPEHFPEVEVLNTRRHGSPSPCSEAESLGREIVVLARRAYGPEHSQVLRNMTNQ